MHQNRVLKLLIIRLFLVSLVAKTQNAFLLHIDLMEMFIKLILDSTFLSTKKMNSRLVLTIPMIHIVTLTSQVIQMLLAGMTMNI